MKNRGTNLPDQPSIPPMPKTNETRSEKIESEQKTCFEYSLKTDTALSRSGLPEAEQFYSCALIWLQRIAHNLVDINVSLAKIAEYCDELKAAEEERRFNEDF